MDSVMMRNRPIEPFREVVAYEALWESQGTSFKKLSSLFASRPGSRPSDFVDTATIQTLQATIRELIFTDRAYKTNMLINGTFDYPKRLRDAKEPVEMLYYSGNLDLLSTPTIAVVGSRKPSVDGLKRTRKLVTSLVRDRFTIVSGLAEGIDTMAHQTALEKSGRTIAVIGTPLNKVYPRENEPLQQLIARQHLLISQVPFFRYNLKGIKDNRLFFPERNKTMSALIEATVIVEAGETSGTLIQARAALYQSRRLFIPDSCFSRKDITWPRRFLERGAIRVKEYDDISEHLRKDERS